MALTFNEMTKLSVGDIIEEYYRGQKVTGVVITTPVVSVDNFELAERRKVEFLVDIEGKETEYMCLEGMEHYGPKIYLVDTDGNEGLPVYA